MKIIKNQQGAVLLFTVLITGLAAVTALLVLSRSSIDAFVDSDQQEDVMQARANLMGCADELLLQFYVDPNFNDTAITTTDAECVLSITNPGGNIRYADLSLTQGLITREVHIEMTVASLQVTKFIEQP
jgi:hypothetical protein